MPASFALSRPIGRLSVLSTTRAELCDHDLARVAGPRIGRSKRLVTAQERIKYQTRAPSAEPAVVCGEQVESLAYVDALRALCALLLAFGEASDIGCRPAAIADALRAWVNGREQRFHEAIGNSQQEGQRRNHAGVPCSTSASASRMRSRTSTDSSSCGMGAF
jgi:hypothetical protein